MNDEVMNLMVTDNINSDIKLGVESKVKAKPLTDIKNCRIILTISIISGLLFVLCFKGAEVLAAASSLLFFNGMSIGLYVVLKMTGIIKNKRAFLLAIPIFLLSLCNAYFEYSYYNIFNCIGFYILYTAMTLKAVCFEGTGISNFLQTAFNDCCGGIADVVTESANGGIGKMKNVFIGVCMALPVMFVIVVLLYSGDSAFCNLIDSVYLLNLDFSVGSVLWTVICFCCVSVYFCGYFYSLFRKKTELLTGKAVNSTIAVSFLTPVNLLFLVFCISQLSYVGKGMELTEFTSYSRYAREGFFQLLFVTFINFGIILVFTELFKDMSGKVVRSSLITLCGFTFALILSSYYRMYLYITAYGFTPLRMEVLTFLSAEVVLVAITVFSIAKSRVNIIRHFVFFGILGLLVLNVIARPEVSATINHNMNIQDYDYMTIDYYTHTEIPLLVEMYEEETDTAIKAEIALQIDKVTIKDVNPYWQSYSIQQSVNNNIALRFADEHK